MARKLREAAGRDSDALPDHETLVRSIRRWESGKIGTPSERYRLLFGRALQMDEKALFSEISENGDVVSLLVSPAVGAGAVLPPGFTVESVEALLDRLYRLDAEFGGNELCEVVAGQAQAAADLFGSPALRADERRRLYLAMAGLTQIAGWLSIDASRHAEASRYLTATIYAAHEADDLSLAGHALGYMSLHALYRDQPSKALALARTATDLTRAGASPGARVSAHNRVARALARLGEVDACRRSLDLAQAAYAGTAGEEEPRWVGYVGEIELSAQRGACFLDLGLAGEAISEIEYTISLVRSRTPEHARDLAHYTIRLAAAYLSKGEVAHAAVMGGSAHRMSSAVGSARVRERFTEFMDDLSAHKKVPQVRDLAEEVWAASY
ncbi:hypothetical protein ACQP1V_29140 [Microtetraspora malaysiensis]|uniref:hypothetical protein n=1 Tax=Microtetraspora malaysiensis TaxID=161358 RepID=UPI003D94B60E